MMRRVAAGLLVLPLLFGLALTIGMSDDLLYPPGDDERLVTARIGAWLAAVALVAFFSLEAFPSDRRGTSGLVLAASAAGVAVAIAHDMRSGIGLSLVSVFFVPAMIFASVHLLSSAPVAGSRNLLITARRKLAVVGCATGLVACYIYFMTGTRGLVVDFGMLAAAMACATALLVGLFVVWTAGTRAATITVIAAGIGVLTLRDYFIWQAALLSGSAYLSYRLANVSDAGGVA